MKKQVLFIWFCLLSVVSIAQTDGFNYKALITDNGNVFNNQNVTFRFTILQNGSTAIYQETQNATTDANGIVAVNIGEGTVISGDFSTIDWGAHTHFLKVEIDTGSGYSDFGTSAFKYVPYAKYADKAGNVFSGDFTDLTNVPAGLSDGDDVNDADHDATNELQNLTFDNASRTLTISNGNSVTIPAGSSSGGDGWGTQVAATDSSINGDGSSANPLSVNTGDAVFSDWDKNASDDFSGSFTDLTNVPAGLADGDDDTQLTETQVDAMVANNGYLTGEVDGSTTNELQTLSVSGNQLTISNGNTVTLPTGSGGDQWGTQVVETDNSLSGDGTAIAPLSVDTHSPAFNGWDKNASDDFSGNYNDLTNTPVTFYRRGTSSPPIDINNSMYHLGNVSIGNTEVYGNVKLYVYKTSNGSESDIGIRTKIDGNSSGDLTGQMSQIQNSGNNDHFGFYSEVSGNGSGDHIGYYSSLFGSGSGPQIGIKTYNNNSGDNLHEGINNTLRGSGTGEHIGIFNNLLGDGTGNQYGIKTSITNTGNSSHYGNNNFLSGGGSGNHFGTYNELSGSGSGLQYGTYNYIDNTENNSHVGTYNVLNGNGTGEHWGVSNYISGSGSGEQCGTITRIINSGSGNHYGAKNYLSGSGSGDKFGTYNEIIQTAGGTHYAVYGKALKEGSYAGYFSGDVCTTGKVGISMTNFNTNKAELNIGANGNINQGGVIDFDRAAILLGNDTSGMVFDRNQIEQVGSTFHINYISDVNFDLCNGGGDVIVHNKLRAPISGDTDMKAYIYGSITSTGITSTNGANSDGFSITKLATGEYKIDFDESTLYTSDYTVFVNLRYGYIGFITIKNFTNYFRVYTYGISGTAHDLPFNFVVYKK